MRLLVLFLALIASLFCSQALAEQSGCCAGCGQQCCLKPMCRLVCEKKIEVQVVYDCLCEDFCTLGPSKKCGEVCEPDCCGHTKKRTVWQPTCGHVRHRHVLLKHEVETQVPHYKCVVEYVCDRCCCCEGRLPASEAARLESVAVEQNVAAAGNVPVKNVALPAPEAPSRFWSALFGK
jgi:hypothetical protein